MGAVSTMMSSEQIQEILEQLAGIRRRIDELHNDWEAHRDALGVIRGLDEVSARADAYPRDGRASPC